MFLDFLVAAFCEHLRIHYHAYLVLLFKTLFGHQIQFDFDIMPYQMPYLR